MNLLSLLLLLLTVHFVLDTLADALNLRQQPFPLPPEFEGYYDSAKYQRSQAYSRSHLRFQLVQRTLSFAVTVAFLVLGGFPLVDQWARSPGQGTTVTGLLFAGILAIGKGALNLPFSLWSTFVIEEKFGFNRTTPKLFVQDALKGLALGALLGGAVFAGLLWFFETTGELAWLYAWIGFTAFQLVLVFLAPVLIMPLFSRFQPLEDSPLKTAIENYARTMNFELSGIFKSDASRRSTKTNAYFTGFGRFRRLVLFDTLIHKHTTDELVAVVAHEIGHFKRGHILKSMALSILMTCILFRVLVLFLDNPVVFEAFQMEHVSVYAGIVFAGVFLGPIMSFTSPLTMALSRKFEYEADAFAIQTFARAETMISALKRLSAENLSNLFPHPLSVWLHYTHPPVLKRISAIRARRP